MAVDDGSTDGSREYLSEMAESDGRIKVFRNSGRGIPRALEMAFDKARGDLVTRMDADDVMPSDKLYRLSSTLRKSEKNTVVVGQVSYFSEVPLGPGYKSYQKWLNDLTSRSANFSEIYRECSVPSSAWMLYRQGAVQNNLFQNLKVPEDYDLCFRLYERGYSILGLNALVHLWRDHPGRTSRNFTEYDIRSFGPFKLERFLRNELKGGEELVLWGCGKKGKELARHLHEGGQVFTWVTENENKAGNRIHDHDVFHAHDIEWDNDQKIVVAVSSPSDKESVGNYLELMGKEKWQDYFFFF